PSGTMPNARVGDHDFYYEIHGSGDAPPAVLIMGLGSDLHMWERQLDGLGADRRVLIFDNRGVGRSAKPRGPYSTAEMADDTLAVIDAAGFEQRVHVVGISLGGTIAQQVAIRHPARVRSVTLMATFGRADKAMWAT